MNIGSRGDDKGISLIELIVYVLVGSILLLATTAILINSWTTQRNVTAVSDATNRGQVITSTVERAMRNAVAFDVSMDGTTLLVHTSLAGDLTCQGFFFAAGESRMYLSPSTLSSPSAWSVWQPGIAQRGSTPFFAETGATVAYTFDITTTAAPVRFAGQAAARSAATGVSAPCW
jgi:Tfp pilus assembly protein PilW